MTKISIIIPISPKGECIASLLSDLKIIPEDNEIILATAEKKESGITVSDPDIKIITAEKGRAKCLNKGANEAEGDYLWFVHADSRIPKYAYDELEKSLKRRPESLHYFNLRFLNDGPPLMILNEWGAKLRSLIFKAPFGDQGFCIKKELFDKIGGFPEDAEYGEDHLFTWYAKQNKIPLKKVDADLLTSARKYKENGWLNLTLQYQFLWIKQAYPEWKKLMKARK